MRVWARVGTTTMQFAKPGRYEVRIAYTPNANRADRVPIRIRHAGGNAEATLDQKRPPGDDAPFAAVGTFEFDGKGSVEIRNEGTTGYVVIDAVQFLPAAR